ncbi:39S ribosomal protein L46, mitochondrial-like [Amphibalanus amphitrite]|uniref:39S ribosomal protein L46, mitochondrial-like n=1 Tax=Amphibalanus amphitrite TaxID=1232801 RepID=UPI001C908F31|nr:39S ribosomal protein L46, mitochondrial-like [Amphibalanus amphitrite]
MRLTWCSRRLLLGGFQFSCRTLSQAARAEPAPSAGQAGPWHLYTAVCLQRLPVVAPPLSDTERRFAALLRQLEFERSLKSSHEIRHEMDIATAEALRASEGDDPDLAEAASLQTAADFEDACAEELAGFEPAPTVTEADRTADQRSLQRRLSSRLVLVVQQRLGAGTSWMLPQGRHQDGATLRQTAEQTLDAMVGPNVNAQFLGNAPWGFYKYKYPKPLQQESGAVGGKVFFYKAVLRGGSVEPVADRVADHRWLTAAELGGQLRSGYRRAVHRLLIDHD